MLVVQLYQVAEGLSIKYELLQLIALELERLESTEEESPHVIQSHLLRAVFECFCVVNDCSFGVVAHGDNSSMDMGETHDELVGYRRLL